MINIDKTTSTFNSKIFGKALASASSGKAPTKNEVSRLESEFKFVKWFSLKPESEIFICLNLKKFSYLYY